MNLPINSCSGYHRELSIAPDTLPWVTSYNALGHIHLSQPLQNVNKPSWYAGSADRRNLGEIDYQPQVLLITLPAQPGGVADVMPIPLTRCTPFIERTFSDIKAVRAFCDEICGADPLGRVTLDVTYADRAACEEQIRKAAPRLRIIFETRADIPHDINEDIDPRDVIGTVRDYIEHNYANADERARLLAGFERLWEEVGS